MVEKSGLTEQECLDLLDRVAMVHDDIERERLGNLLHSIGVGAKTKCTTKSDIKGLLPIVLIVVENEFYAVGFGL